MFDYLNLHNIKNIFNHVMLYLLIPLSKTLFTFLSKVIKTNIVIFFKNFYSSA